ncbi:MAG: GNAT family N-acetyltransferase [Ignavibacteria bacterium]|nr:GNAT family N-acetyltransferase [Ignavibacteria bacterium]
MNLIFKEIKSGSDKDLKDLSLLASKIWNDHYPPIIGQEQVDYMLGKFYSLESLKDQMNIKNNIFIGAYLNNEMVGFISYSKTGDEDYFIHKLYIKTETQRIGIGRALLEYVLKNLNPETIRLTVNRQNFKAINFYFKLGFTIEKIIDIDIENGFVMNDFVMLYMSVNQK